MHFGERKNARYVGENGKKGNSRHLFTYEACIRGKGKRHGKSGTVNRDTTVPLTRAVARGTTSFQFCQQFFMPINIQRKFRNSTEQLLVIVMN